MPAKRRAPRAVDASSLTALYILSLSGTRGNTRAALPESQPNHGGPSPLVRNQGAVENPPGRRSLAKLAICDDLRVETRGVLYWRQKRGPFEAKKEPSPNDVGLAWVVEADGSERYINNGEPIRRAEAVRLATAGEYTLDADP